MSTDLLLRLLARTLPVRARQRYLEEWRADRLGAAQLGLPTAGVLLGAAALALRIDRDRPEHTGEPRGAVPRRLARRSAGLLIVAGGILAGLFLTGGNAPDAGVAPSAAAVFTVAARVLAVLALGAGALGALLLGGAVLTARTWLAPASLLALALGPGLIALSVVGPGGDGLIPLAGFVLLLLGLTGGTVVFAGSPPLTLQPRAAPRSRRAPVALAGLAALLAVVVLGGIDVLVWNPSAKVPGLTLSQIYTGMVERDGFDIGMNVGSVVVWALFWSTVGIVVAAGAVSRSGAALTPRRIAVLMLGLISAAVLFRFFAGFGFGMSIGDSFDTGGGDGSVASALLAYVGQLSLAGAAIALGWAPRMAGERTEATPPGASPLEG